MATPEPVLAHAAQLLSPEVGRTLAALVRAVTPSFEREFLRNAGPLKPLQKRALAAVTPGAAIRLLAAGGNLSDFFEQVEYNGRRLAKLDLPPAEVLGPLREYARRLDALARDKACQAACEQLNFAILLTVSNAFHQVGEAETAMFSGLARAELDARAVPELLESALAVVARYSRADEARFYRFDESGGVRLVSASPTASGFRVRGAAGIWRPRYLDGKDCRMVLDPDWCGRMGACWSVPVGTLGVMQFAFPRKYPWLPRELRALLSASEHILLAWQKQRLAAELRDREQRLRELTGHMAQTEERERLRIGRELHDETGQVLLYLRLKLEMLEKAAPEELRPSLAEARELMANMVTDLRRLIADLTPTVLETAGLPAAVRQLANRLRRTQKIYIRLQVQLPGEVPQETALLAYRLMQECLSNVARHSSAKRLNISLSSADGSLRLSVKDDGVGFRMADAARKQGSFGLAGMRERVTLAGGRIAIESQPGKGCCVKAVIPLTDVIPNKAPHPPKRAAAAARSTRNNGENPSTAGRRSHAVQAGCAATAERRT
ncbi:MAG TPA: GAF domain-containing sensor histidine kinase [Bryobacteraceae bacterium]|nr:GAF domain-containing sensor histidine kinase [Bryobacteraceae bacterium]